MSDWLESGELLLWLESWWCLPLLHRSSHADQLLSSFVGNSSRAKLLFCLIFLANLHIQAIFCLPSLFAIPFCEGIVLFFASGLRTNLSFYYYFMFYTCLNSMCPLVSVFKLHFFCRKACFHIQGILSFSPQTSYRRNTIKLLRYP